MHFSAHASPFRKTLHHPKVLSWLVLLFVFSAPPTLAQEQIDLRDDCTPISPNFQKTWPQTDFSKCTVSLEEVMSGGPGKDGIPAINSPLFQSVQDTSLSMNEPVISVFHQGIAKAYPLNILVWHEIVNDIIADKPISVTYCPLCNASIVFDRRLDAEVLDFGTTGNLRNSDLVMYDRQTESWFQQYTGTGLFGALAGKQLTVIASQLEPYSAFVSRHPDGIVLQPPQPIVRPYGTNPYIGYDSTRFPMLFNGTVPDGVRPMDYVIIADDKAWALEKLRQSEEIIASDIRLSWKPGQNSALDTRIISDGRDIGHVTVERNTDNGYIPEPFKVSFAFVWHAFHPDAGHIIY